jgi:hypothetical protein
MIVSLLNLKSRSYGGLKWLKYVFVKLFTTGIYNQNPVVNNFTNKKLKNIFKLSKICY